MYELEGVSATYTVGDRTLNVIDGLSLTFADGEFTALLGPSGSGKSTVLNMLAGFLPPTHGTVRYNGADIYALAEAARAEYRNCSVGMIHQAFNLIPEFDAVTNVAVPLLIRGVPHREAITAAELSLESLGVLMRAWHRPSQMSGGEQQRAAAARALVTGPDVLLADEPTGNLDRASTAEFLDLIGRIHARRHITIIVATHDEAVAAAASKRITIGG